MADARMFWDPGVPPGAREVLAALRQTPAGAFLHDDVLHRPWDLVEVLLDQAESFEPTRRLELLIDFLGPYFDRVARMVSESWLLLLNVELVADDAIAKVFMGLLREDRVRPFESWARRIVESVCQVARFDAEFCAMQPQDGDSAERAVTVALGRLLNTLDMPWRRVAWLSWVELRSNAEVVDQTGLPLEQVEHMLESMNERAIETLLGGARERSPDDVGSEAFWREMERGQEDG